jgi:hypothetical protein
LLLTVALVAALGVGCGEPSDRDVPDHASKALDCPGKPWRQGSGNYDTGPESVQDDPRAAVMDFVQEEGPVQAGFNIFDVARRGGEVLFVGDVGASSLAAWVVHDGMTGPGQDQGWGVYSWAYCDPSYWPDRLAYSGDFLIWSNADGDRMPTSVLYSFPGPEHCGWQDATFLFLGEDGEDGAYVGNPLPEFAGYLRSTYAKHAQLPVEAEDTGYQREGNELWITQDAAYVVDRHGNTERWPAEAKPISCG